MSLRRDKSSNWIVAGTLAVSVSIMVWLVFSMSVPQTTVRIGDGVFKTRLAMTSADRAKGLSGQAGLDSGEAVMLVFDHDEQWGIWMKDMHFPIDIIWLDSSKKVVHIVRGASPDSYPDTIFEPDKPARYVLEVPAGVARGKNINLGGQAIFNLPNQLEVRS